jgi:hypothetical protein
MADIKGYDALQVESTIVLHPAKLPGDLLHSDYTQPLTHVGLGEVNPSHHPGE